MDPTSGHMGIKRTLARISERFAWPGMAKDVEHLVRLIVIGELMHALLVH